MRKVFTALTAVVTASLVFLSLVTVQIQGGATSSAMFDVVIKNGRVMDPESGLDAVRSIAIKGGKVAAISARPLGGKTVIDARNMVVAPGFIDLHAHGQTPENYTHQAMDGVTTALELEIGVADIDRFYSEREAKAAINYGATVGHVPARMEVMHDPSKSIVPSGDAAHREATPDEIETMKHRIEQGLKRGALGVGFGVQYTHSASRWEIFEMFRVAGKYKACCHVHIRDMGLKEPANSIQALEEVIADAAVSGASLHMVHVTSMGLGATPKLLEMIGEAQKRGLDVTTEVYPYTAGLTDIASAIFDTGWQQRMGIDYKDLQWTQTAERLTAETFERYRKTGGMVVLHTIPEDAMRTALRSPLTAIASDGGLQDGKGHPRSSGTYSRVLGRFVREEKLIPLMEALRKMTLMPARRLERYAPAVKRKGRIKVGADADITIFDPEHVIDRATYEEPAKYSEGIKYVLVGGVMVVRDGELQQVTPGRGVRAPLK
jgi:N-acyl-D-aspartate/D-glutamate deacylase